MEEYLKRLDVLKDKILQRVEARLEGPEKISAELLGVLSDITKDMASTQRDIVKSWHYLKEEHHENSEL